MVSRASQGQSAPNRVTSIFRACSCYDYLGNQLTRVDDSTSNTQGFKDVSSAVGTQEYRYDQNGNMVKDTNKGITSIQYNYMNLPQQVTLNTGTTIHYTYDATGIKHQKVVDDGSPEITTYIGGFHCTNNNLQFLQHAEGRALKSGSILTYEYNLTDHLGNVRVSVDESGSVVQRDGYYPFGMAFNSSAISPENKYKFQGQEHQDETGWDQFKWRNSDPALGRFFNIDPLAEEFYYNSTYAFSENKVTNHIELEGLEAVFAQAEARASGPLVGPVGVTGSGAVGVALDTKGNIGVYYTVSAGPQVGGGATAGIAGGVNLNVDDIYGLEGFGVNAGGFLTTSGAGVSKSGEINLALDTNMEFMETSEGEGGPLGKEGIVSGGFSLGSNYSAGFGASGYVDVSFTQMIGSFNIADGLEGITETFMNSLQDAGVNPEDLGVTNDNVGTFIQSVYDHLNAQLQQITENQEEE